VKSTYKKLVDVGIWDLGADSEHCLLQGVVRCVACDTPLHVGASRYKDGRVAHYHCRNAACSERAFVRASVLDEFVERALLAFYGAVVLPPAADEGSDLAEAERALEDAQYDLGQWVQNSRLIASIGADAYAERAEELSTLRNLAQAAVEEIRAKESDTTWRQFQAMWETWTHESRREFVSKEIRLALTKAPRATALADRVEIATADGTSINGVFLA
jgi:hypothetical protein